MKNLRTSVLCACMILFSLCTVAQDQKIPINEQDKNKPHLFDHLPAKISFDPASFIGLGNKQTGSIISTDLSADAKTTVMFEGKLVSSGSNENGNTQSIVVKSTNYPGATFSMSKVIKSDGTTTYSGRLMSFKHGDLYILQQTNGQYELIKKNFYDLVNE
ncbi:MAG: hypothetical protein HOP10_00805 [Chitinophagaceae bacterium]|nr:hypothetical protein [Chitinophagaceae bacterium]